MLGDIVGYGPDPNAVVARLRSEGVHAIQGNHDLAVQDPSLLSWFNEEAAAALDWTRGALTEENRRYLAGLPKMRRLGPDRCVHGSPRRGYAWEYILDEGQAGDILDQVEFRFCFYGHTHLPRIFAPEGEQVPPVAAETEWIPLPERALVNPGSVGQPRDGYPDAAFAVVDLDGPAVQFWRVPYDIPATQAKIVVAGLPMIEAVRLSYGR